MQTYQEYIKSTIGPWNITFVDKNLTLLSELKKDEMSCKVIKCKQVPLNTPAAGNTTFIQAK